MPRVIPGVDTFEGIESPAEGFTMDEEEPPCDKPSTSSIRAAHPVFR